MFSKGKGETWQKQRATALSVLYFKRETFKIMSFAFNIGKPFRFESFCWSHVFDFYVIILILAPQNRQLLANIFDIETKCSELNLIAFRNKFSSFASQCYHAAMPRKTLSKKRAQSDHRLNSPHNNTMSKD